MTNISEALQEYLQELLNESVVNKVPESTPAPPEHIAPKTQVPIRTQTQVHTSNPSIARRHVDESEQQVALEALQKQKLQALLDQQKVQRIATTIKDAPPAPVATPKIEQDNPNRNQERRKRQNSSCHCQLSALA
jgi:hypothetical protein